MPTGFDLRLLLADSYSLLPLLVIGILQLPIWENSVAVSSTVWNLATETHKILLQAFTNNALGQTQTLWLI